jgi:hypothetical protein
MKSYADIVHEAYQKDNQVLVETENIYSVEMTGLGVVYMKAPSVGALKMELRKRLKADIFNSVVYTRVPEASMIKHYRKMANKPNSFSLTPESVETEYTDKLDLFEGYEEKHLLSKVVHEHLKKVTKNKKLICFYSEEMKKPLKTDIYKAIYIYYELDHDKKGCKYYYKGY